jgi:hypothetical protein
MPRPACCGTASCAGTALARTLSSQASAQRHCALRFAHGSDSCVAVRSGVGGAAVGQPRALHAMERGAGQRRLRIAHVVGGNGLQCPHATRSVRLRRLGERLTRPVCNRASVHGAGMSDDTERCRRERVEVCANGAAQNILWVIRTLFNDDRQRVDLRILVRRLPLTRRANVGTRRTLAEKCLPATRCTPRTHSATTQQSLFQVPWFKYKAESPCWPSGHGACRTRPLTLPSPPPRPPSSSWRRRFRTV